MPNDKDEKKVARFVLDCVLTEIDFELCLPEEDLDPFDAYITSVRHRFYTRGKTEFKKRFTNGYHVLKNAIEKD